jgi:hypothetical protein
MQRHVRVLEEGRRAVKDDGGAAARGAGGAKDGLPRGRRLHSVVPVAVGPRRDARTVGERERRRVQPETCVLRHERAQHAHGRLAREAVERRARPKRRRKGL